MKVFGEFTGYESEVFDFEVPAGMVPEALIVPKFRGKDRDFVIVPERKMVETVRSLRRLGSSKLLDERYAYVAADGMLIDLKKDGAETMTVESSHVQFAVVRWNRKSRAKFPYGLTCIARVGETGPMSSNCIREIILAAPNKK